MTLGEMRTLVGAGSVASVTLEGIGQGFCIVANLKNKSRAVLKALHADTVREYKDPRRALEQLKSMGIVAASIEFARWDAKEGTL